MDFTFVCPTEIAEFGKRNADFRDRDAQVLGASAPTPTSCTWPGARTTRTCKDLPFPMLADTKRELSRGARHPPQDRRRRPARDLHRRSGGRHPLRQRQRPVGRPQRRRGAARARRAADRRALPVQLEEGRADAGGRMTPVRRRGRPRGASRRLAQRHQAEPPGGARRGQPARAEQRWGVAVASAVAARHAGAARRRRGGRARAVPEAVVEDGLAAAALMAMNNVYYRFRHMVGKPVYAEKPARLRMNRMAQSRHQPQADFELFCLAVSAINGCEACVRAHEKVAVDGGISRRTRSTTPSGSPRRSMRPPWRSRSPRRLPPSARPRKSPSSEYRADNMPGRNSWPTGPADASSLPARRRRSPRRPRGQPWRAARIGFAPGSFRRARPASCPDRSSTRPRSTVDISRVWTPTGSFTHSG